MSKVEITFNRRNSFSLRIEASRSKYESARRIPLEKTFILRRMTLKGDGFFNILRVQTENKSKTDSMNLLKESKSMFFSLIGDPTINVITNWQMKDGELIQSELPPTTQYQLPKVKDSHDKPVMVTPFKTKDVNEEVTSKDIKSLMEQANYTNKYLQVLGESVKTKTIPKQNTPRESLSNIPIEKPLFKPFRISDKAKQKIRELRKNKSLMEGVGDNNSELLNKLDIIPETPQPSEGTLKMVTRSTSKLINVINDDSDQHSGNTTEIDAQMEYNIMNTLQYMTMVATAYQTSHECSEETIIDISVEGFFGQLKGWWDNYLTNDENSKIHNAVKMDLNGKAITNDDNKEIPDVVNTLIFTIAQHFIGDPSFWKDRSAELLSNLKCRTLADFRWYRDTFLTRVYIREDSQQPFWKEKFLVGLLRSLGDKVRDKIHSQSVNGDIPYESLSYGQLISYVQKVALKICQDNKIQRQLAKREGPNKERFRIFLRYSHKPSISKETDTPKPKLKPKITCYNCGKQGHISKYCRLKRKLRNLNLEPEETKTSSSTFSEENLNIIQQDDQPSSTDDDDEQQINTLTREQDLLFEAINSIPDPHEKKVFLEKLKKTLETKPKDFITNNKFDNTSRAPQILYLTISPVNSYRKTVIPPKETGTYLRGGRSSGKGFKLALPESTIKKSSSTSSGSPTQARSSTQKSKIKGSSTQIVTIKLESSTQEPHKPATSKQTAADYAWSIQTLQALQEMGLAKLPPLTKKTWANIASKSDDDSKTSLQNIIQNSKTIVNSKGKHPLS
ncbi:hypothetical protein HKD37_20G055517 [Glycine soja]